MKIAILTSSRADYGFYRPLLKRLFEEKCLFEIKLVVFGTHLSPQYGYTINNIISDGYDIEETITCLPEGDSPYDISKNMGELHLKFTELWSQTDYDLLISIGDRYEMYAAVTASVPFNIPVAHISGGEETEGAIDNIFRHCLTHMSKYHFTNTEKNTKRVIDLKNESVYVFETGSLAIDNIKATQLLSIGDFALRFNFDLSQPFVLFTFHPETINYNRNIEYSKILESVLTNLEMPVLATMPNTDTSTAIIRNMLEKVRDTRKNIHLVESLGSAGYYTALHHCYCVLGNSSSGIIEVASFGKYVLNIGDRQKGREFGKNVIHCEIDKEMILERLSEVRSLAPLDNSNIYGDGFASKRITEILKNISRNGF